MNNIKFNYSSRTFADFKKEQLRYVHQYYPELSSFFSDSDVGEVLIDLTSAIADNLSYHTDRMYQEQQIDYAQQRRSLFNIAHNKNLNIPSKKPSITIVSISLNVPVLGDSFNSSFLPTIQAGAQFIGGGRTFEAIDEIDFKSPFNSLGTPNRTVIPNIDSNDIIQNYTVTKNEIVYNGATKFFKKNINDLEARPFLEVLLPDKDVISVEKVLVGPISNTNYTPFEDESMPYDEYYMVDSLAQQKIFMDTVTGEGIKGQWERVTKKYIKEYTYNGYTRLTFGGGVKDFQMFQQMAALKGLTLPDRLQNQGLGEIIPAGSTLYVKYRVGGGSSSNIGANILTSVGNIRMSNDAGDVREQQRTLNVTNPIPAFGGADEPTNEEIRYFVKYNTLAQNRAISISDYKAQVHKLPGKYGSPFRVNAYKRDNKIIIPILGIDGEGKLMSSGTNLLKDNIANYLSGYRGVNDYVEVHNGQVFNISMEITLYITDRAENMNIVTRAVSAVRNYFDINKWHMDSEIYMGGLTEELNNIENVLNVLEINIFNETGAGYSPNVYPGASGAGDRKPVNVVNDTLFGEVDSMFEIKYPERDIRVFLKKRNQI